MYGVCMYGDDINRVNRDGKLFESWWKDVNTFENTDFQNQDTYFWS